MKTYIGLALLAIGVIGGIGFYFSKTREKKRNLETKKVEEKPRKNKIELRTQKKRTYKELGKAIEDATRETIMTGNAKNRNQLGETIIRKIVPNVNIMELGKVPKTIDELEDKLKELGLWEDYESYLETLYTKKEKKIEN